MRFEYVHDLGDRQAARTGRGCEICRQTRYRSGTPSHGIRKHNLAIIRLIRPPHINTGMTTTREMELSYVQQQQVIEILNEIGDPILAQRLQRCMIARQRRHYGDGWPLLLPIVSMLLVSSGNDEGMVVRHPVLGSR